MGKLKFVFLGFVCIVTILVGFAGKARAISPKEDRIIKGIHVTSPILSTSKGRKKITDLLFSTELNAIVIDVKDDHGHIYINGIEIVKTIGAYVNDVPDLEKFISDLKEKGIYTIARIIVFRDDTMARRKLGFAIKNCDGSLWTDKTNIAWLDPYNIHNWDYVLQVAEKAVDIGFDEIQFDYVRFPSEGNAKNRRYCQIYSAEKASKALVGFLKEANRRLKAKGTNISIDVFGLTTTATDDMGIGQKIVEMTEWVDFTSPMVYPSHYGKFIYGIENPNKEPYKVVYCAIEDALKRIPAKKLRPWLQNFSLHGYSCGKNEVRAQIQACYDNGVGSWLLWSPKCTYTTSALKGTNEKNTYRKSDPATQEMLKTAKRKKSMAETANKSLETTNSSD
ncbi:MAG: putative glycoside hydrolase [Endomicrobium sp.]|nr:putative glycoside hydrolase [Endomicrobium sp.]